VRYPADPSSAAWLARIAAEPNNPDLRLIWADQLEESPVAAEQARGRFIRLQLALAQLSPHHPRYTALHVESAELEAQYLANWAGPLRRIVNGIFFEGGLPVGVIMPLEGWLKHHATLAKVRPRLRKVRFCSRQGGLELLAQHPHLRTWTHLDFCALNLTDHDCDALRRIRHLDAVESLNLSFNQLTDDAVLWLLRRPWPRLKRCSLAHNRRITQASLSRWWDWMEQEQAVELDLSGNQIESGGLEAWPESLDVPLPVLSYNPLGADGAFALAKRPTLRLPRPGWFDWSMTRLDAAGLLALMQAPWMNQVTTCKLAANYLGDDAILGLAGIEKPGRLRELILQQNMITQRGLGPWLRSGWPVGLTLLDLSYNMITTEGIAAVKQFAQQHEITVLLDHNLGSEAEALT